MSGDSGADDPELSILIDKVCASKAGHAFHEAWAARTALELLPPATDLVAITLEGFGAGDERAGSGSLNSPPRKLRRRREIIELSCGWGDSQGSA